MRPSFAAVAAVALLPWATRLPAQSAFEQLEQQVQRENAQDAARQLPPTKSGPEPGYLGVIAEDRQGGGKGLNVIEVIAGAPAERAGLKAGDFITTIDGQAVHSMQDFERILSAAPAGKKLTFAFTRGGQSQNLDVTLGQRPPPGQRRFEQFGPIPEATSQPVETRGTLGVRIASITPELQRSMSLTNTRGALIVSVVEGSAAAQSGLVAGNVILSVDGQQVETPADLTRLIARAGAGRVVTLGYYNGTANVERKVVLGGSAAAAAPADEVPSSPPIATPGSGFLPGQPPGGPLGAPGQFGAPGPYGTAPGQFGPAPGQYGQPGQFGGDPAAAGPDRLEMLEQRVRDLERRLRELESKNQAPSGGGPKATQSSDQQT
ncbi:MAG TPA: PDZ domain-containing protein [Pirellulales bacterium]|nr:PDZ domain-containing protein [Pirellulales bacterium]